MHTFSLIPLDSKKDPITGKASVFKSVTLRVYLIILCILLCGTIILRAMNYPLPAWADMILFSIYCAYILSFWIIFIQKKIGKAIFEENKISIIPAKKSEQLPDSPIYITANSAITFHTIRQSQFPKKTLLHIVISDSVSAREFGFILKNKKDHLQYLELLDLWYKRGITVREFNTYGHRVFKLSKGQSYADVQNIKQEYGLEW